MTDITAEYGTELRRLCAFIDEMDEVSVTQNKLNPAISKAADQKRDLAIDRRQAVEAIIRETQASSIGRAIVQVMLASATAGFVGVAVSEDWGEEIANMQKLLYSAAMALEAHAGADRSGFEGENYMPVDLNPFGWEQAEAA